MIAALRRQLNIYGAFFAMTPKMFMAYVLWFWAGLVLSVISMAILVFLAHPLCRDQHHLWARARQTIRYILLALIFMPLTNNDLVWEFGSNLREGTIIHHLFRPVNFQAMNYA